LGKEEEKEKHNLVGEKEALYLARRARKIR
jgi:hypothetical protein